MLDEPTSNLDVHAIEELKKTIQLWKAKGKTIAIAEHRLYWLMEVCDRVLYLKNGEITMDMPAEQFYTLSAEQIFQLGLRTLSVELPNCIQAPTDTAVGIELRNFSFSYYTEPNLRIPSLALPKGAVIAVIGNNGAGKSTFTHCLS